jgi:hypothetical protein
MATADWTCHRRARRSGRPSALHTSVGVRQPRMSCGAVGGGGGVQCWAAAGDSGAVGGHLDTSVAGETARQPPRAHTARQRHACASRPSPLPPGRRACLFANTSMAAPRMRGSSMIDLNSWGGGEGRGGEWQGEGDGRSAGWAPARPPCIFQRPRPPRISLGATTPPPPHCRRVASPPCPPPRLPRPSRATRRPRRRRAPAPRALCGRGPASRRRI